VLTPELRVGIVSDTHGLMRPEAMTALRGSNFIVHAGDIGDASILEALSRIAPVTAVRGNNDRDAWAMQIPEVGVLKAGSVQICVIHDTAALDVDPAAAGLRVVVCGHSHRAAIGWRDDVLFINPGSAGRRRFSLPVSVATLSIVGNALTPRILELDV
jgi:putative phosphoesterase